MNYFVSPDGSDTNPGSETHPFRTFAKVSAVLQPGDSCVLRGGVYRETLRPGRSGTASQPIVFRAADGETAVISGADVLSEWRTEGGGLWSASMPWDLEDQNQLFCNGAMLSEARWPHNPAGSLLQPPRATAKTGTTATLTDPELPGGADAWSGALLWCCGGYKWICWAARVTGFDPATRTLTFDAEYPQKNWYTPREGSEYVLMGSRAALGAPGQWWYDRASRRVWLCPPTATTPATMLVEAKARLTAIDLRNREHIHLHGLRFRAGGLLTDDTSRHLHLERLTGEYVAHSYARDVSDNAVLITGERNCVRNCEFAFSSGSVLRLRGRENSVVNCFIHDGDYAGLWSGTLSLAGRRHIVSHNTVRHSGRDLVSISGLMESVLQFNDLSHAGWLTSDLGIMYGHSTDFANTEIRFNWVHDSVAGNLAEGIYFDHCSHNAIVHHNLIWNIPVMPVQVNNPSHFNLIAHNSCLRTNTAREDIHSFDHSNRQDLFGTRYLNNLVNAPFKMPENTALSNNIVSDDPGYVDPARPDFRLRADSVARGAALPIRGLNDGPAPDAGAIPFGQFPWRAGHDFARPPEMAMVWSRSDIQFTNRLFNPAFELGTLEGWSPTGPGTAEIITGNGWGNAVSGTENLPTGTCKFELRLGGGTAGVEQVVRGLRPHTRYQVSGWIKVSDPVQRVCLEAADFGGPSVAVSGNHTQWTRLVLEFTTGHAADSATIRLRKPSPEAGYASADNLGLVELP